MSADSIDKEPKPLDYFDWREFLADRVEWCRSKDPTFSFRKLARDADLGNHSNIYRIISGTRNLDGYKARSLGQALELSKDEINQFGNLVRGVSPEQQKHLSKEQSCAETARHFSVLSIAEGPCQFDPEKIARASSGLFTITEVEDSLNYLKDIGILEIRNNQWAYSHDNQYISTDEESDDKLENFESFNFFGRALKNSSNAFTVEFMTGRISTEAHERIIQKIKVILNDEFRRSTSEDPPENRQASCFCLIGGTLENKRPKPRE